MTTFVRINYVEGSLKIYVTFYIPYTLVCVDPSFHSPSGINPRTWSYVMKWRDSALQSRWFYFLFVFVFGCLFVFRGPLRHSDLSV